MRVEVVKLEERALRAATLTAHECTLPAVACPDRATHGGGDATRPRPLLPVGARLVSRAKPAALKVFDQEGQRTVEDNVQVSTGI